jgi:hypothetical protein
MATWKPSFQVAVAGSAAAILGKEAADTLLPATPRGFVNKNTLALMERV